MRPVFLFAFANDIKESLNLNEEWRRIVSIFYEAHEMGQIELVPPPKLSGGANNRYEIESITLEQLFDYFDQYHNRIHVFHFAGHSDSKGISLSDSHFGKLESLIGHEEKLKLVFLNGCNNMRQAFSFMKANVSAIIATKVPVEDSKALQMTKRFYSRIALGNHNINDSFDHAKGYFDGMGESASIGKRKRDIGFDSESSLNEFEWILLYREEKELTWKVPMTRDYIAYKKVKEILDRFLYEEILMNLIRRHFILKVNYSVANEVNTRMLLDLNSNELKNKYELYSEDLDLIGNRRFDRLFGEKI